MSPRSPIADAPKAGALAAALLLIAPAVAAAQAGPVGPGGQAPGNNPVLSPYLGLLNGRNSTAFNYYEFVRPQQQFNSQINNLRQDLRTTRQEVTQTQSLLLQQPQVGERLIGVTGHSTSFGNTGSYFGNVPSQFGGRRAR